MNFEFNGGDQNQKITTAVKTGEDAVAGLRRLGLELPNAAELL